jgi:hypothetical protein
VGGESIDSECFDSQNVFTKNYKIYRGGNFQIVAEVDVVDSVTNTPSTIYSEPMTLKVKYPDWQAIEDNMTGKFTETWDMSKVNPGRYEYGYYVFLENHEMVKGELCEGDYNPCSSLLQTVTISDSETSTSANPTTEEAIDYKYFIAQFHTHPSLHLCNSIVGRNPVGASPFDLAQPNTDPYLPRFVYDYEQPIIGGHDVNAAVKIYCYAQGGRYPWN